jgi:uncharacterized membrane protein YbhN (UPF0104 family)
MGAMGIVVIAIGFFLILLGCILGYLSDVASDVAGDSFRSIRYMVIALAMSISGMSLVFITLLFYTLLDKLNG